MVQTKDEARRIAIDEARLTARETRVLAVDDCRKCQTATATPAEPGDLLWILA